MKFYTPKRFNIINDLLMLLLSFYVVLDWFPLTTSTPFEKYSWPTLYYTLAWVFVSYLFKRYKPLRKQKYYEAINLLYPKQKSLEKYSQGENHFQHKIFI